MSALTAPPRAPALLSGFGRATRSRAVLFRPAAEGELEAVVVETANAGGRLLARGLGRAYGDAAQCAGGAVVQTTALDRIVAADLDNGIVTAQAGCSVDALLRFLVPRGWFLPVTPGTAAVTLGGLVAADVHGKNHHRDSSFGAHLRSLRLVTARGTRTPSVTTDAEVLWATVGGMGLTGIVTQATFFLTRIETSILRVDVDRACDLDACCALLSQADREHQYSVAWLDAAATGRRLGRAIVSSASHARRDDLTVEQRRRPLHYAPRARASLPLEAPVNVFARPAIALANSLYYRMAPRRATGLLQDISTYFYPLDAVTDWNRAYGPAGFTQYQFVVPHGAGDVLRRALETFHRFGQTASLAVLKSFGPGTPAPLSFPMPGWTLALDFPLGDPRLAAALDAVDELVAGAGGRVYLAKDGRLRPELLAVMYPRLAHFLELREALDPDHTFASDLALRLGIGG